MRFGIVIILLIISSLQILGQDIVVTTNAPSVVAVGEQFQVTWTANSRGGNIDPPEFIDFYLLMGPQTSYNQSTQIVNGKVTSTIKNSFTYYLQATKEGKFNLGPAKYIEKNREYLSRAISIEVVKEKTGGQGNAGANTSSGANSNEPSGSQVSGSDLFIRLLVNRAKVTMGEHLVATLKIYSRANLSGIQEVKYPDFNGFLKTDLETEPLRALERENVNGQLYNTGVLQRFLIYPQKTGKLEIEPSEMTVLLQESVKTNDPFFGDFFSSFNTVPKVLVSPPVQIDVTPLPVFDSESFYGTVGKITLKSTLSRDSADVNDALTFKVIISGNGNLRLSSPPQFMLSPDIEVYEPNIETDLSSTVNGTEGSKTFEYILIPRHHGQFDIPQIEYTYFDPDRNRYNTLKTSEHRFFVKKGNETESDAQIYGSVSKEDVTYLGRDIRYINTGSVKLRNQSEVIISRSSFLIVYISLILIFTIILFWRREHVKRNSDILKVKNRKAARVASGRLKLANRYLKEESPESFHAEILRSLWGYLSDKLTIPVAEMNIIKATEVLKSMGIDIETIDLLKKVIEECEYSRYAPEEQMQSSADISKAAERIIKVIENEL